MPYLVTKGSMLRCSMGSSPSQLGAVATINAGGSAVATIASNLSMTNIPPFGVCQSSGNPQTAGVGSAPCVPKPVTPWSGSASVTAGGLPVLNSNSICQCQWGGQISVLSPGQQSVSAG